MEAPAVHSHVHGRGVGQIPGSGRHASGNPDPALDFEIKLQRQLLLALAGDPLEDFSVPYNLEVREANPRAVAEGVRDDPHGLALAHIQLAAGEGAVHLQFDDRPGGGEGVAGLDGREPVVEG